VQSIHSHTQEDAVHIKDLQSQVILNRRVECWLSSYVGGQHFLVLESSDTFIISQKTESSKTML